MKLHLIEYRIAGESNYCQINPAIKYLKLKTGKMKFLALTILIFAAMSTADKSNYLNAADALLHYVVREPKIKSFS